MKNPVHPGELVRAKLFPFFTDLISRNGLFDALYCEPYAGGAGLAIKLLTTGFVERVSINDIDSSIYAFWVAALRQTDKLCSLIEKTPVTIEEWYKQRVVWREGDLGNTLALGFSAYFLNRTNRSGIIEGAGPIGGYAQNGPWKLDVRLSKNRQIDNIKSLAKYGNQIDVSNLDALDYLDRIIIKENSLTYLDPPYYVKGHKLYKNFYKHEDHMLIADELLKRRSSKWVVSYDDVPEIRGAYSAFIPISYSLGYSAGQKSVGTEVIFLSDTLLPPKVKGFETAA